MKILTFLLLLMLVVGNITAQPSTPPTARPLALGESLRLALENSAQIQKARIDRQILERRVKEARSEGFPQIGAGVNLDYWPLIPTQLLPGEIFNQPEGTYVPAQFGQPWQLSGNVMLQQNLINEAARRNLPALKSTRDISDLLIERSEYEVIYNTSSVFYQTLQMEQLLRAVDANLAKLEALQGMAQLQLDNGYAVPTDVKRIRVAKTNLETQRQNLLTGISSLRQTLLFLCGLPLDQVLDLSAEIGSPAADSARWQSLSLDPETTTESKLLVHNLDLLNIQRKSAIAEALPSLSAYAILSAQGFRSDINFFDIDRQWYGAAGAGVKLKIPIFDGFRVHNKAWVYKLEAQKLEQDLRQLNGAKALEFRQAREQLGTSLRTLRSQSDNVALAREITDKLVLQYKEGVASLTDLLNAQTALSEAETNYWQQVFSYKLAVLKLLKTAGQLELLKE
ncbi:MAG: TolC family protein [Saprospiraceae bacterium]|nr:TolC family protein [Saprospiraceae bacterium]